MSVELKEAMRDDAITMALKRLYNYKRLRELGAPPLIIERANVLLQKSKVELGSKYVEISTRFFDEFRAIEDAAALAGEAWEAKCQTCTYWLKGYSGRADEQWCGKHTYQTRTIPDECPDFQLETEEGK